MKIRCRLDYLFVSKKFTNFIQGCKILPNIHTEYIFIPDVFSLSPAAMLVFNRGTPTWRLHTKLYKFVWNILSKNSSTEYRTDLTIGQIPYLFIIYNMSIS